MPEGRINDRNKLEKAHNYRNNKELKNEEKGNEKKMQTEECEKK